jgi:hypothetical protein
MLAGMTLRPLAEGDEMELRRIHATPEVVRWWDVPDESFPWDEPESPRLTIVLDGAGADRGAAAVRRRLDRAGQGLKQPMPALATDRPGSASAASQAW